ncbi:hypothetical protein CR513_31602, partial [Mucuna pruriens]
MLDLGASINVMPTSIYKSLNFGDLEPTRMTIQLANRSGILEDVFVQVNKLIFLTDFYVLDMKDKTSRKGSTLILGRPFLMIARTKIDVLVYLMRIETTKNTLINVHVGTLSMEFGDTLVQFNIFEAMKHPTKDHSHFGIDLIDELVEECLQIDSSSRSSSCRDQKAISSIRDQKQANAESISDNQGKNCIPSRFDFNARQRVESDSNPTRDDSIQAKRSQPQQLKAEIMSAHLVSSATQVGQPDS